MYRSAQALFTRPAEEALRVSIDIAPAVSEDLVGDAGDGVVVRNGETRMFGAYSSIRAGRRFGVGLTYPVWCFVFADCPDHAKRQRSELRDSFAHKG